MPQGEIKSAIDIKKKQGVGLCETWAEHFKNE